jgi:hypothetical protein
MGVSGQHHAPAALYPGKGPLVPIVQEARRLRYFDLIAAIAGNVFSHRYVVPKVVTPRWPVVRVPSVLFYIHPKFRKRQIFKFDLERCITGKFHQRFLGFYRKVTYFLTDCVCKWISHPFMLLKG